MKHEYTLETAAKRLSVVLCMNETQACRADDVHAALAEAKANPSDEALAKVNRAMRDLLAEFGC